MDSDLGPSLCAEQSGTNSPPNGYLEPRDRPQEPTATVSTVPLGLAGRQELQAAVSSAAVVPALTTHVRHFPGSLSHIRTSAASWLKTAAHRPKGEASSKSSKPLSPPEVLKARGRELLPL